MNGFADEGWSLLESDGIDAVTLLVNSSVSKMAGVCLPYTDGVPSVGTAVMCAKASMLLQVIFCPKDIITVFYSFAFLFQFDDTR